MSFFAELKRRNVVRVGIAYAVVAWLLAQIADLALGAFEAPGWTLQAFLVLLALGFPLSLFFAWAFELTSEGIKRDRDVDRSASTAAQKGRALDRIIIGVLGAAVAVLLIDEFYFDRVAPGIEDIVAIDRQSIAVLPFVNMSDDSDHFADGLSEELLNLLAKNTGLKVAGRTSSFVFKGRNEDLRAIGEALSVEHLLEGSVRRSGDRLRITAQLIKVDDGFHVWSDTYDRAMTDVFDIQDDVADSIADALQLHLAPHSIRPTDNAEAYALYLAALAMSDFPTGEISEAIALLDRALELDPEFAKAHELKAMAYWQAAGWTIAIGDGQKLVHDEATSALELNPDLIISRAYAIAADPVELSWINYLDGFEAAFREEPGNVRVLDTLSTAYLQTGYFQKSLEYAQKIIELEPLSNLGYDLVGYALSALGKRDEARAAWEESVARGGIEMQRLITIDHLVAGEIEAAISSREKWFVANGWDPADVRSMMESAADPETGKAYLDQWISEQQANADSIGEYGIYTWYLAFGHIDEVIRIIDEDIASADTIWVNSEQVSIMGIIFRNTGYISHPNFVEQNLIDLWEQRGAPDICSKIDSMWTCE